jgi:hypothetical protein
MIEALVCNGSFTGYVDYSEWLPFYNYEIMFIMQTLFALMFCIRWLNTEESHHYDLYVACLIFVTPSIGLFMNWYVWTWGYYIPPLNYFLIWFLTFAVSFWLGFIIIFRKKILEYVVDSWLWGF